MIPSSKIEEIRERADIVEVISSYVPLKNRGKNYVGLCPFHSEKTPSFSVNREKKIFYCFGCHAGGSVITFLIKHEGMSFPDAARMLARRYGVKIVEEKKEGESEREIIISLNLAATDYFTGELRGPSGAGARRYLKERGYEGEIVTRFRLGYAPAGWEGLAGYLKKKGIDMGLAEKAGLLGRKEKRHYDRFRGRIMFPITDPSGRVVAFGGRIIGDGEPKYLNSPESPVFRKAETLYALYQAKQSISKEGYAIMVEGYFDLLALHLHGFTNSVATMGTAVTPEHIRRLKPYAGSIYALFDSDEAGRKAALRGLDIFIEADMPAKVVLLPSGKDPDEFLRKEGASGMGKAIKRAEPVMEFFLKELKRRFDISTAGGKASYLNEAIPHLVKVSNVAEKGHYAAVAAADLGIDTRAVYSAMNAASGGGKFPSEALKKTALKSGAATAETVLLKVVLKNPGLYGEKVEAAFASFKDPFLKEVASCVKGFFKAGGAGSSGFLDGIGDEDIRSFVAEALFKDDRGFIESPQRMLDDCMKNISGRGKLREGTSELLKKLKESGNEELVRKILSRIGKQ
ncbi:MAG: DNA primase [Deltaproteobacteria bacterium]|nr:DNA primase [Deltaproteobacteria bacterium]